jgi:hypothetical protein
MLSNLVVAGGSAVLVTTDGTHPDDVPAGIEVIDLNRTEQRLGLHVLLSRSPIRWLRSRIGPAPKGPTRVWARYRRSKPYRAVAGWMAWRALRRHLDQVRVQEVDHVILVDLQSWPIAWQINRLNRSVTIGWDVPDELFDRVGRPRPEPSVAK